MRRQVTLVLASAALMALMSTAGWLVGSLGRKYDVVAADNPPESAGVPGVKLAGVAKEILLVGAPDGAKPADDLGPLLRMKPVPVARIDGAGAAANVRGAGALPTVVQNVSGQWSIQSVDLVVVMASNDASRVIGAAPSPRSRRESSEMLPVRGVAQPAQPSQPEQPSQPQQPGMH